MGSYSGWYTSQSPYSSLESDPIHSVTDEDFCYITSDDLEDSTLFAKPTSDRKRRSLSPAIEDDVIILKNKGITYPAHFPAYSIFDGRVTVKDVRNQLSDMMALSERATGDIKLLYKGHNMGNLARPVRDYGVKNNSEVLAVVRDDHKHRSISRATSAEDILLLNDGDMSNRRAKKRKDHSQPPASTPSVTPTSPDFLDTPKSLDEPKPAPTSPSGPINKLDEIADHFSASLMPLCERFIVSPPRDLKKCDEDHRKLSETIFQQILLKLDGVEMEGNPNARARRKQLVQHTQEVLQRLDEARHLSSL